MCRKLSNYDKKMKTSHLWDILFGVGLFLTVIGLVLWCFWNW